MQDMLVSLITLPEISTLENKLLSRNSIVIRRPIAPEKKLLVQWVENTFGNYWASETDVAFSKHPIRCFVAQTKSKPIGFSCYDTTSRGFFGPTGVDSAYRGIGVGKILLVKALKAMREMNYGYAIIGGVGPAAYYEKTIGATLIEGSEKNIYNHLLKNNE
jgi:ribosomal protein S18 acetylase RimI-like enzyme